MSACPSAIHGVRMRVTMSSRRFSDTSPALTAFVSRSPSNVSRRISTETLTEMRPRELLVHPGIGRLNGRVCPVKIAQHTVCQRPWWFPTHKPWKLSSSLRIRVIESLLWHAGVSLIWLYEHMTAPTPARTASAKLGRYSSLTVLSVRVQHRRASELAQKRTIHHRVDVGTPRPVPLVQRAFAYGFLLVQKVVLCTCDQARRLRRADGNVRHGRGQVRVGRERLPVAAAKRTGVSELYPQVGLRSSQRATCELFLSARPRPRHPTSQTHRTELDVDALACKLGRHVLDHVPDRTAVPGHRQRKLRWVLGHKVGVPQPRGWDSVSTSAAWPFPLCRCPNDHFHSKGRVHARPSL